MPECTCQTEFVGKNCELSKKSLCDKKNCLNGGTCAFNQNEVLPKCLCTNAFHGTFCELKNICPSSSKQICYNNGSCLIGADNKEFCKF
jgi:hypothetical protein